jgi:hypothetical protein
MYETSLLTMLHNPLVQLSSSLHSLANGSDDTNNLMLQPGIKLAIFCTCLTLRVLINGVQGRTITRPLASKQSPWDTVRREHPVHKMNSPYEQDYASMKYAQQQLLKERQLPV